MHCPQCGSQKLFRDGLRYLADGTSVQRWLCKECGYRFSDPNRKKRRQWKNPPFSLNPPNSLDYNCRGNNEPCRGDSTALGRAVQTLATVEKQNEKQDAGATVEYNATSEIINFMLWLKRRGYSESTVKSRGKHLRRLVKLGADLRDPETVKEVLAKQRWSPGYKELFAETFSSYLSMKGGKWEPPRYKRVQKLPFIPLEKELDQLIACFPPKMACLLQLLKETGCRIGEAVRLSWKDVDFESGTVRITPEKGSNPRVFHISSNLRAMLRRIRPQTAGERIFPSQSAVEAYFYRRRKQAANKLCNPRLLQISFHTFRHWKATMEYARTKDILHVMRLLGHKNIHNTLIYTQLVNFKEEEYVCRAVKDSIEAISLIEAGFEYVCTAPDGVMLFRKRK
ncbi:MAG: tyrosine-type recombinase/integrase [Candidatus Bathyarchaeia archaeon]